MKWMLIPAAVACLMVGCISSLASAAIIEHHLVVDPDFTHERSEGSGISAIYSYLSLDLPSINLNPGDLLRVTVELSGGKSLKLSSLPPDGYHYFSAEITVTQAALGSSANGNGATETVRIFDTNGGIIFEETELSRYWASLPTQELNYAGALLSHSTDMGEPVNASFHKWLFEIEMPTTVNTSSGSFPVHTTTFNSNTISLSFSVQRFGLPLANDVAVFVVPEPASLVLAGLLLLGNPQPRAL